MARGQLLIAESDDPTAILDTLDVDHSGETVKRQILALGGAADDALVEPTAAAPAADAYGVPTRVGDGHDANAGATTDAAVAAGAAGSLSAKLRRLTTDIGALLTAIQGGITTVLGAGESHVGAVGGEMVEVATEFTRPSDTTPYTAGDMVSNDTTTTTMQTLANVARKNGGSGFIVGMRLTTDKKSVTPRFRVRIFHTSGVTLSGDNLAYKTLYADGGKRVGYVDLPGMSTPADTTNSDQSEAQDFGLRVPFVCDVASKDLYYVLEALDGFTPANGEKFRLRIYAVQN